MENPTGKSSPVREKDALLLTEDWVCLFSDEEKLKFRSTSDISSYSEVTVTNSWVCFPPTLAHRKISSPAQRASLSLVKFQDYTIIHPTQEAEDNTLAGEETSKNTVQALTFHARLFLEQFWIGRSVHVSAYTHHQVGGLLFSVAAKLLSAGGGGDLCSRHLMGN